MCAQNIRAAAWFNPELASMVQFRRDDSRSSIFVTSLVELTHRGMLIYIDYQHRKLTINSPVKTLSALQFEAT